MLVLSRKKEETIRIGDQVEVKVLSVNGNQVRLGLTAPRDITIMRGELNDGHGEESDGVHRDDSAKGLEGQTGSKE